MNCLQIPQISLSPMKKSQQYFPAIYLKTTESPQKGQILQQNITPYQLLQNKTNNRKCFKRKDIQLEKAYTIRKYLQAGLFMSGDSTQSQSKILQNTSITDQKDITSETRQSTTPVKQIQKIDEIFQQYKSQEMQQEINNRNLKTKGSIHNECILELDQENDDLDQISLNKNQDLLIISPILQQNFNIIQENKQSKSQSPIKQNIVLKINQQNQEYKKYASQMIRMIRNAQQQILKGLDQERLEWEKDYKLKKIIRQKERKEALQNAQEGIKNRQLKSMLIALKGSEKKVSECPLFLNMTKKNNTQGNSTCIQSRKSSISKIFGSSSIEKESCEKKYRKQSMKSEICSLETSLELPLQIQKII